MSETTQDSFNAEIEEEKKPKKSLKERLTPKKKEPAIEVGGNIFVSLIPDSHKRAVEARKSKNNWTVIFGLTVLICVVVSAAMFLYNLQVQAQLSSELEEQGTVDLMISKHAEVHQAMESEKVAKELLGKSAGNEIDWGRLVGIIEGNLPGGTSISSMSVTTGGMIDDDVSSSVTLNLTSNSTFGYSDTLNSIQNINGVTEVQIGGLASTGQGGYSYKMTFTYDTTILTERFSEDIPVEEVPVEETPVEEAPVEEVPFEEGEE